MNSLSAVDSLTTDSLFTNCDYEVHIRYEVLHSLALSVCYTACGMVCESNVVMIVRAML